MRNTCNVIPLALQSNLKIKKETLLIINLQGILILIEMWR